MKIISWNVNGIRACQKKGLLNFIERQAPDILCLQETKARPEQLDENLLHPFQMQSHFSSAEKKGYSGVATFLNKTADKVSHGIGMPIYDLEGRFVVTEHKEFDLYNVYFPNGARGPDRHKYKMSFLKDFSKYLKGEIQRKRELIVLGDFNVAPQAVDVFDPVKLAKTSGFLPEEREWFQSFLDTGFVDSFRKFHPDEKERYTWWNQMERARIHNRGWRIDLICLTSLLSQKLKKAQILDDVEGSDHCPISIELDFSS